MKDPISVFRQYCKEHKMRYTPERELIIKEIYRKDAHFDVDSLFLRIRNRYPDIKLAKGSVYRTIPHLIRAGLIRELLADGGHACYEYTLGHEHHDHIKCLRCGKTFEFFEKEIDRLQTELCKKHNFTMLWHIHVISGYCAACAQKTKNNKQTDNKDYHVIA